MAIQTRVEGQTIHVDGYVTTDAFEPLEAALAQIGDVDELTLAFGESVFINSSGLAVLLDLLLPIKHKQITLTHPKPHFRRVFEITGMTRDFTIA